MSVEYKVDQSQFQAALRKYVGYSKQQLPQILNTKMFYIARGGARETPKAERHEIEHEMGVTGYALGIRKDGNYRRTKAGGFKKGERQFRTDRLGQSRADRIIQGRRLKAGKKPLSKEKLAEASRKMIAARMRAAGTEKAGWWRPISQFAKASGNVVSDVTSKNRVKGAGQSKIAKPGWSPEASIAYNVNFYDTHGNQSIDPRVVSATQKAFDAEARSMESYMSKKMQPEADKINAK